MNKVFLVFSKLFVVFDDANPDRWILTNPQSLLYALEQYLKDLDAALQHKVEYGEMPESISYEIKWLTDRGYLVRIDERLGINYDKFSQLSGRSCRAYVQIP